MKNEDHLANKGDQLQVRPPGWWAIKHGLYLDLDKYRIDGRSALGQNLARSKAALQALFPNGADAPANLLINQIVYIALRLEVFSSWDMVTGEGKPTAIQNYIALSNSLRSDLQVLMAMADREPPKPKLPDFQAYFKSLCDKDNGE